MLRPYQGDLKNRIYTAWQDTNVRNVMATMATGGGKSVVICSIVQDFNAPTAVIAHRSFLVSQLALTLNREGVPHGIIAPKKLVSQIVALEIETHGRSHWNPQAPARVGSAHTLAAREAKDRWYDQVALTVVDEGHHVTQGSIWHRSMELFPRARGLLKTAHGVRADGMGLGRPSATHPKRDGVVDALVVGPFGRELIDAGYLCDYEVRVPPSDVDISDVPIGDSGDFSPAKLSAAVHASKTIVGDVVRDYIRFAGGKLGLTFAVDIAAANEICNAYNAAGVPAAIITDKTPIAQRGTLMRRFTERKLLQLVSVDVLGEGTDVPAVEVVSLARHTASWQLYCQQVGRSLRPYIADAAMWGRWDTFTDDERLVHIAASPKPKAIIIDHVGNFARHYEDRGTPDSPQFYSMERREKKAGKRKDAIPLRTCLNGGEEDGKTPGIPCFQQYEAFLIECPYCKTPKPAPGRRSTPEQVEGDLLLLDLKALRELRAEVKRVDAEPEFPLNASAGAIAGIRRNHMERQLAQGSLREAIAFYGGARKAEGLADREIQSMFWREFGVDVMTAQTLGAKDALTLHANIHSKLSAKGYRLV